MYLIASIALIHLIACLSPGPDIFLVILNSIRHGHRSGMATTVGILCGVTLQISIGIAGITYLVGQFASVHTALALAGSLWLIQIGVRGIYDIRRAKPADQGESIQQTGHSNNLRCLRDGFLVNVLNPKALLYFLGLFSVMLGPEVSLSQRLASGAAMLIVQALAFFSVAILIDRPEIKHRWQPVQHLLEWVLSIILVLLGSTICLTTLYSLLD